MTLVFLFDLFAAGAAWVGVFLLRFNLSWPGHYTGVILTGLLILIPAHALICWWAGLYRGLWIFASLPDLKRVLRAVALSSFVLVVWVALHREIPAIPRSSLVLYPILLAAIMAGGRVAYRMWKEHRLYGGLVAQGKPVVIVGAGTGGAMLLRELERSRDWRVVGLVDDDRAKQGRDLLGHKVFGPVSALPQVLEAEKACHVILAMPSASAPARRTAANLAIGAGAQVFVVPGLEDLMGGRVAVSTMRRVEIDDLLGRDPVYIDTPNVQAMIGGRSLLVTGAGGSIGSELCRQLARFAPERIVLYEQSEFALHTLEQWFAHYSPGTRIYPLVGDVKDEDRLAEVFAAHRPDIVFHAAAYKHVPLMEVGNAWQAVRNNVLGTLRVAEAAVRFEVGRFVLISTDKAVNPTNVMGATKRLAEMVCETIHSSGSATKFEIVRFGNVLGSAGSVIPKFQEQIARGGPVTVTHPEITRYFMSIPEATQLILQAAAMGTGGEIFMMDMGEPVRIADLARKMILLSGFTEKEIRIEITGLRAGEKLYEELLADAERTRETPHPKLRIAQSRPVGADFLQALEAWLAHATFSDERVRTDVLKWVPEYRPTEQKGVVRLISSGGHSRHGVAPEGIGDSEEAAPPNTRPAA